jgi:HD-GYP domain-containing protein (c-di-GMP phosphodiesterase class II)
MKLPRLDMGAAFGPAVERMLYEGRERRPRPLTADELRAEGVMTALLVIVVTSIALGFDDRVGFDLGHAAALTVAFALAAHVRFSVGPGYTSPVQLVFFPMLFFLPPAAVPICVTFGYALAKLADAALGRGHRDRVLTAAPDAWFSVGPALVFAAAQPGAPDWGDSPIYLAALVAEMGTDIFASTLREWVALRISPRLQLAVLARVYMVDALLTPVAVMAAIAADGQPYRVLLVLPIIGLFAIFAQEREANIANALQLSTAYRGTALLLGDVLEDKDAYTAHHSHGVVSLSLAVADRMRLDPAARRRVEFGALLHDIGKIAVPADILNKPGPLDADEWSVMKLHTVEGQQMLDRVGGVLGEVGRVVRSSHEHFDGTGYPDGLAGEHIPIESRIVACCDAFSAMTTTRTYRKAMSMEAAREELVRNSGTQFDPDVVTALLAVIHEEHVVVGPDAVDVASPAPAHSVT